MSTNCDEHAIKLSCTSELLGDAKDCHVIIVDDLVQTGGTLIECAKVQNWIFSKISQTYTFL